MLKKNAHIFYSCFSIADHRQIKKTKVIPLLADKPLSFLILIPILKIH